MTITEKIIAAHCGRESVSAGEFVYAEVDLCLGNDITAPIAIREFESLGVPPFDTEKIALIPDHFTPNKDIKSAEQAAILRAFARKHGLKHYFEIGRVGIEHALLPEQGIVGPGDLVIGADSHTCTYGALAAFSTGVGSTDLAAAMATGKVWLRVPETLRLVLAGRLSPWVTGKDVILHIIGDIGVDGATYRAMEFAGEGVAALSVDDRLAICNMAIEAGAKNGIMPFDDATEAYVTGRARRAWTVHASDADTEVSEERRYDLAAIPLTVSLPHLPSNTRPAAELRETTIDQVVIGSCTNGRLSDLRVAAQLLKGRKVHPNVRAIVLPGTQQIYLDALREGIVETFIEAGAAVSTPTCGPCLGGHMGILARGERALATTNRNFVGRMGHPESEVYLAGPPVAAASAVTGRITCPEEILGHA
jgi:3-isopropylmalate/(R)-2-methylmalate dehydratase large subunit